MGTVSPDTPWSYTLTLPHDPRSARIARLALRGVLSSHAWIELADVAELLLGELVANAYRYSHGPTEVQVRELADCRLRIGVWDTNPKVPPPFDAPPDHSAPATAPEPLATCGRGLRIVRSYADDWGSWSIGTGRRGASGKLFWCELGDRARNSGTVV
ncbi:ATP-binding protein [Streptomyces orinoci]|uniref:ATP-binding protein n=1 Tax=Streptomyces orinoci TaxID=67339 RepID=A0ABV3JSB0_STRON|nr:ATP-binding protein [Streptomyces orinoci]